MHRHYSCNNSHFIIWVTAWLSLVIRSQRKKAEKGGRQKKEPREGVTEPGEDKNKTRREGRKSRTQRKNCEKNTKKPGGEGRTEAG